MVPEPGRSEKDDEGDAREKERRRTHGSGRFAGVLDGVTARLSLEDGGDRLAESGCGQAASQGQGDGGEHGNPQHKVAAADDALESRQVDHGFGEEGVARRQAAERGGIAGEHTFGDGHIFAKSAHFIHGYGSGGFLHGAGEQEQRSFEEGVIPDMEHGAADSTDGHGSVALVQPEESQPHAEEDDAHVLNAGIRQQAFEIALGHGEEDAH